MLSGCGGGNEAPPVTPPPVVIVQPDFVEVLPEWEWRTDYYGILTRLNENSWDMLSHTVDNPTCERSLYHGCKKVGVHYFYDGNHTPGRERKTTFEFTVNKWNYDDAPYHVIIFQNHFLRDPLDLYGHPYTTLKLKAWRGVSIAAYNNRWQWDYDYNNPYNDVDPADNLHQHPEDEWTGQKQLEIGQVYQIEIIMTDGLTPETGEVIIHVDGELLSHAKYQTKPVVSLGVNSDWVGMYSHRDYNPEVNTCVEVTGQIEQICKATGVTYANYRVFERVVTE